MAVFKVLRIGDSVLREQAKSIDKINSSIYKLLDNLTDTMYNDKGVGLAAPQIGVSKRVVVADLGEGALELINPLILESSGEEIDIEGCLSIPGVFGEVPRAKRVIVKWLDRKGRELEIEAKGFPARILQHEIDHLEGILFTDKAIRLRKPKG